MVRQSAPQVDEAGTSNPIPRPDPVATRAFDPTDRTNPLHLHPNESPALQLVTVRLEGRSNYHPWARAMEMALRSKNKLRIVDGTMVIPSELDQKYYYWDQCNTMVLSWILRAVSPTIGQSVLWINTAEGVWKDLKKRFSQQDVLRIGEIQSQIHQTKQGNSSINEALRFQASLPEKFWGDYILHAVYIINRLPSATLNNQIPYQILFDKLPKYQHLRIFGCLTFAVIPSCKRDKFSPRARKCIFLGLANGVKGYKLFDIQTEEILISRDVSFYEDKFPFQNPQVAQPTDLVLPSENVTHLHIDEHIPMVSEVQPLAPSQVDIPADAQPAVPQPRRSARVRSTPTYLNDYNCQSVAVKNTSPHDMSTFPWSLKFNLWHQVRVLL
nr:uncharacterized protein LOC109157055 [Ipomoea batatas]